MIYIFLHKENYVEWSKRKVPAIKHIFVLAM